MDLAAVDAELDAILGEAQFEVASTELHQEGPPASPAAADTWENENTEVEIIDDSDFVLLVDEGELEELEKVGEDDALQTSPAAPPDERDKGEAEGEGSFFKKLFGGRRTSSSP